MVPLSHCQLYVDKLFLPLESYPLGCEQPASAIPPHMRLLNAVAHLEKPRSPDPLNNGTMGTAASGISRVKTFRASARAFQKPHSKIQGSRRKKQKQKVGFGCDYQLSFDEKPSSDRTPKLSVARATHDRLRAGGPCQRTGKAHASGRPDASFTSCG